MIAVLVNCAAVIVGSAIGLLCSKKITEGLSEAIRTGAGVVTLALGIQMALKYQNIVCLSLSLVIGGVLGTVWDIDGKILAFGRLLQRAVCGTGRAESEDGAPLRADGGRGFAYAFLNASVLFCVGAMSIIGSFKAGIERDYTIIFTKSVLDGFMAISLASAMGVGTAFSALVVFVYQGALTLLSVVISPLVSNELLDELTGCGGAIIIMIALNLLGVKSVRTANYLPAFLMEILFAAAIPFVRALLPPG
ncbi:MAG: DUF554 domain-containing protein [Treponemataceae bacterium]|nr:DUF554 domain-containing protein [Treponemataceae bacterium]